MSNAHSYFRSFRIEEISQSIIKPQGPHGLHPCGLTWLECRRSHPPHPAPSREHWSAETYFVPVRPPLGCAGGVAPTGSCGTQVETTSHADPRPPEDAYTRASQRSWGLSYLTERDPLDLLLCRAVRCLWHRSYRPMPITASGAIVSPGHPV